MKILVLAYKFPLDSSSAIVSGEVKNPYNFCVELKRQGHDVTVFSIDSISNRIQTYVGDVEVFSVPDLKIKGVLRYLYRAFITFRWVKKNAKNFDLVHSHASFFGLGVLWSGLYRKCFFLSTPHGTNIPEISTEIGMGYKDRLRKINAFIQMKLDSYVYRQSNLCVSVSKFQIKEMNELYDIPANKINVIYNGVSRAYDRENVGDYQYDYLFVGRAAKKKGLDVIIRLAMHFESASFKVVLGTERFKTVGNDIIESLEALKNVDVEWAVSEQRMPSIYASSKVLVVPSRGYESLPTVILEAIRSRVYVVATKAWGNPEVILDERLMFEEDDFDSMLSAIEYVNTIEFSDYSSVYSVKCVEEEVAKLVQLVEMFKL